MKTPLLFTLFGLTCAGQALSSTAPKTSAPISQLSMTQYTGDGGPRGGYEPIYKLVLRRDGTATYVGSAVYMNRIGRYQGKVSPQDFERLARILAGKSFPKWRPAFAGVPQTRFASEKFEIVRGGSAQAVAVSENVEPREAREAWKVFYGLLWKIRWSKVSGSDGIGG